MATGIGSPDWQRRYVTSAVPLLTLIYPDNVNSVSPIQDSNGYQYLMMSTNSATSTVYAHVKVDWYQDAAATVPMGNTDWTIPPQSFIVIKVPVVTRYYKVEIGNVGGATGSNISLAVYGTDADQENLLTQNTAIPLYRFSGSIAAGATMTTIVAGVFGGEVMVTNDDSVNNKWTEWMEYYDWTTQLWTQFWSVHGTDKGQAWNDRVFLPYAPTRINVRNDDTVAHSFVQCVVAI